MIFGESKCAFLVTDKGKIIESHEAIVMNGVTIKPSKDGDSYKSLGQMKILDMWDHLMKHVSQQSTKNVYGRSG